MPEKILYYFGAGASAQALPLARSVGGTNIEPLIPGLAYDLKKIDLNSLLVDLNDKKYQQLLNKYKDNFYQLAVKADEFGDVDTYAKYLHLMHPGGTELQELKRTLSGYFCIKQLLFKARDNRYLPWMVSIMDRKMFPENVKILNWNYDFQIELAASTFSDLEEVNYQGAGFTHQPSLFKHYPNLDPTFSDFNLLSLIHLNGIAGYAKADLLDSSSIFQKRYNQSVDSALLYLEQKSLQSQFHFAWEKSQYHKELMAHVKNMIAKTTIMVVVGYSFPFFNREVDKQIFEELKQNKSFKKIYYQDPVLNGEQLRAQFSLPDGFDIEHIKSTNNFHIPFEY